MRLELHTDWTVCAHWHWRLLSRVGNTGIPGVWLFHTGNRYSFDNIVPASIGGLLATPPPGGHGFALVIVLIILFTVKRWGFFFVIKLEKKIYSDSEMVLASRTPPPLSTLSLRNIQTTLLTLITRRKMTITLWQVGTLNSSQHPLAQSPFNQQVLMLPPPLQRILFLRWLTTVKMYHWPLDQDTVQSQPRGSTLPLILQKEYQREVLRNSNHR